MPSGFNIAGIFAGFIFFAVLACSAILWISHLHTPQKTQKVSSGVPAWSIGWANFGLFICLLISAVLFGQLLLVQLASFFGEPAAEDAARPAMTPWFAVFSVLTLQVPMLLTFYSLRAVYPESFGGSLNQSTVSVRKAVIETTSYFIRYLPVVWLVSAAWTGLLTGLQKLGLLDEFPPQELVTLLSNSEYPVATGLLAVFAIVLAPAVEEIIFRGAIYRFLKGHTTLLVAQVISGAFFAIIHFNLMSFLPLLAIGIILARFYEKSGNILLPMLFHSLWNSFSLLLIFLI